jgi:hypothetical protein
MNNPIRNPYNKIPLFQSPLNDLLRYAYININKCKAAVQGNLQLTTPSIDFIKAQTPLNSFPWVGSITPDFSPDVTTMKLTGHYQ